MTLIYDWLNDIGWQYLVAPIQHLINNQAFDIFQKLLLILNRIAQSDDDYSKMIRDFWSVDMIGDPMQMQNIKYYTESKINEFSKSIQIQGNVQILMPSISIDQNVNLFDVRSSVKVSYGPQIQQQQSIVQRGLGLSQIMQQIVQYFRDQSNDNAGSDEDIIDWILFIEKNNNDNKYYQSDLNLDNQQDNNIAQQFTAQSLLQYAGVSDCDFVKASFIFWMIFAATEKQFIGQEIDTMQDYLGKNRFYFTIKIAQFFQRFQQQKFSQIQVNKQLFLSNYVSSISLYEQQQIQQRINLNEQQQNSYTFIDDRSVYVIRAGYGLLFGQYNNSQGISQRVNPNQKGFAFRQFQVQCYNQAFGQPLNLDQAENYVSAVYGIARDILFIAVQDKMKQYMEQLGQSPYKQIRVIVSLTIQIPRPTIKDVNNQQNSQVLYDVEQDMKQLFINNKDLMNRYITEQQLRETVGQSQYFTLSFMWDATDYIKPLLDDQDRIAHDVIKDELVQMIITQLSQLMFQYNLNIDQEQVIKLLSLSYGIHKSIIRKVMVRPISVFSYDYDGYVEAQTLRGVYDIKRLSHQIPNFNLNLNNTLKRVKRVNEALEPLLRKKLKGPNALLNNSDYNAEVLFNDLHFSDLQFDCKERMLNCLGTIFQIDIKYDENFDILKLLHQLDNQRQLNRTTVMYNKQCFMDQAKYIIQNGQRDLIIIYMSDYHIFLGSFMRFIEVIKTGMCSVHEYIMNNRIKHVDFNEALQKIKKHQVEKPLDFFPIKKQYEKLTSRIMHEDNFADELYLFNRLKANVFFDFETTFDENNIYKRRGFKIDDDNEVREQTDFAYSMVCDVKLKFNIIVQHLVNRYQIDAIECTDYINKQQIKAFIVPASADFIRQLNIMQQKVNEAVNQYHSILLALIAQDEGRRQLLERIFYNNDIYCFSYNGAKFDNHFVLQYYKNLFGAQWINHVNITGTINDIKIMRVDNIVFYDIKLMTGGGSLKQFCEDLKLEDGKKDISMDKMKTLAIATMNKEEILEYVLYDSIAISKIHKIFMKAVLNILVQKCLDDEVFKHQFAQRDFLTDDSDDQACYKCIVGQYRNWSTISSLSRRVFFDYFNEYYIKSSNDESIYQFCKQSYQGGYTQAFLLGRSKGNIYYLDYNSMYPSIMHKALFFTNLKSSYIRSINRTITKDNAFEALKIITSIDKLNVSQDEIYELSGNDYFLYKISKFKFKDGVFAPFIGLMTKKHGTIYPMSYDSQIDTQVQMPVIFGFQIGQGFYMDTLEMIHVEQVWECKSIGQPLFKQFDEFMYNKRMVYKKQKNTSMALATKIFMNSLYGKFGEKIHDMRLFIEEQKLEDESYCKQFILNNAKQLRDYKHDPNIFSRIDIKQESVYDNLNDQDTGIVQLTISNIKRSITHIGSFVYYASLITAIGRQQITNLINIVMNNPQDGSIVMYADTDSLILNEIGYKKLKLLMPQLMDNQRLGAMKNEYPLINDDTKTRINDVVILNKKIYQFEKSLSKNGLPKDNKLINKFKGCKKPSNDMVEQFLGETARYKQQQTRFIKKYNSMTIVDMPMQYSLRLSRDIDNQVGQNIITKPFKSLSDQHTAYQNINAHAAFDGQKWQIIN